MERKSVEREGGTKSPEREVMRECVLGTYKKLFSRSFYCIQYRFSLPMSLVVSPADVRKYRVLHLSNGLEVLLIAQTSDDDVMDLGSRRSTGMESDSDNETDSKENSENQSENEELSGNSNHDSSDGLSDDSSDESDNDSDGDNDSEDERKSANMHVHFKAAAALCVAAGHFSDPVNVPGLAHFLEHLLFFSTSKYPDESWEDFLASHGGYSNASTDAEFTTYQFEVRYFLFLSLM